MILDRAAKHAGHGRHRTIPAAETLRHVKPLMARVGITRLADITHLDRIGIPVYSAIVPDSPDAISTYNGKGPAKVDAKVGAIMEAIERYAALRPPAAGLTRADTYHAAQVLDPAELVLPLHPDYRSGDRHALVEGFDLVAREPVLVPVQAAIIAMMSAYGNPCFAITTTNGLAAGNTREEAVCHALCELIERDAWTLAELRARHLPEQLRAHGRWARGAGDDLTTFAEVDLSDAPARVRSLARRFAAAGVQLRLKDITSDIGIATVIATALEHAGSGEVMAHVGLGTHPDAVVALTRALTEVAQCRAVDVQALREDLVPAGAVKHPYAPHTRRARQVREGSWYHAPAVRVVSCAELPHHQHGDVLADIELLLDRLVRRGLKRVIAVDLTQPEIGVPVVRMLVPGLESWAADGGRVGLRAQSLWRNAQLAMRAEAVR